MVQNLLEVRCLDVCFITHKGYVRVINQLSFSVGRGEIVGIAGGSGSGKTLTALALLKLLPPRAVCKGEIWLDGQPVHTFNERQMQNIRGKKVAMVFQEPFSCLNPIKSCGGQVAESLMAHQPFGKNQIRHSVFSLFEKVGLPASDTIYRAYPHQLSGGQRQRVLIAMAVSCQPDLLIADEPASSLDSRARSAVISLLRDFRDRLGISVLLISHDLSVLENSADRILIFDKGEKIEEGARDEIFNHPGHKVTQELIGSYRQLSHTVRPATEWDEKRISIVPASKKEEATVERPLIRAIHLTKKFYKNRNVFGNPSDPIVAVNDVSIAINHGETLGLVGESGCGKTTLGRLLLRLIEPDGGDVLFNESSIRTSDACSIRMFRRKCQMIFQDPYASFNPFMTIGEVLTEPMRVHRLFGNEKQQKARAIELLEQTGLGSGMYDRYPHELSGGQRQRCAIARALAVDPGFIVCDEIVSALDAPVQIQIIQLLNELKLKFGFSCLFISHDLNVVSLISDRIALMHEGKIVKTGTFAEVFAEAGQVFSGTGYPY